MGKHIITLVSMLALCLLLAACGANGDKDVSLPDGMPADFPIPEGIVITSVDDNSDDEGKDYYINFTFDEMDVDATLAIYHDYAEKIGYKIIKEGELKTVKGTYQFIAQKSITDMFLVTLKPEGDNGVFQIKAKKN